MNIPEWEWFVRILIAGVLSGVVGWEREMHGRDAGLRTMILVGMGTATIMITSMRLHELFSAYDVNSVLRLDPARIAYGVITGIGFLGAGAIIKDARRIRGLTTAACLWLVTSMSLAIGCGFYGIGVLTAAAAILTLYGLKKIEREMQRETYHQLTVTCGASDSALAEIRELLRTKNLAVLQFTMERSNTANTSVYSFGLRRRGGITIEKMVTLIAAVPDVKDVKWK